MGNQLYTFEICPEFNSLTTDFSSTMPPLEKLINTKSLFAHLIKSLLINLWFSHLKEYANLHNRTL